MNSIKADVEVLLGPLSAQVHILTDEQYLTVWKKEERRKKNIKTNENNKNKTSLIKNHSCINNTNCYEKSKYYIIVFNKIIPFKGKNALKIFEISQNP